MKRALLILLVLTVGCVPVRPPQPVPVPTPQPPPVVVVPTPAPPTFTLTVVTTASDTGRPLSADVFTDSAEQPWRERSNAAGFVRKGGFTAAGWNLCAELAEYDRACVPVDTTASRVVLLSLNVTARPAPPEPDPPPAPVPAPHPPIVVIPPPAPVPTPAPVVVPKPTRAQMLDFHANFCNLYDTVTGQIIFTPAITGASPEVFDRWMAQQRAAGSTHLVLTLEPDGQPAYPGVGWSNPKYWDNLPALRAFLEKVLATPSASGAGFVPVLFIGGDTFTQAEFNKWSQLSAALSGIRQYMVVLEAWEPEGWSSHEISLGLEALHTHFSDSVIAWHGWPSRLVGSSNCRPSSDRNCVPHDPVLYESGDPKGDYGWVSDDPWRGGEAEFYTSHGGQWVDLALYQLPHEAQIYHDCDGGSLGVNSGEVNTPAQNACWQNRWQDYVYRIGAGQRGWRKLAQIVLFETVAHETFWPVPSWVGGDGRPSSALARQIATWGKHTCDKFGVTCGYGNGLPLQ